jgi:hypothetical protein
MELRYDFFYIFERLDRMQIKIEIVFLKEIFFIFFKKPIHLISKKYLACKSQFHILNMKG